MSKKNKEAVKEGNNENQEGLEPHIDDFVTIKGGPPGDLNEFYDKRLGEEFKISLMKVMPTETVWCKTYHNIKPTRIEIGSTWGGGEYRAYGTAKGMRGSLCKIIKIAKWWDEESERLKIEKAQSVPVSNVPVQSSGVGDACKIIDSITPLFKALSDKKSEPQPLQEIFTKMSEGMMNQQMIFFEKISKLATNNLLAEPAAPVSPEEQSLMEKLAKDGLKYLVDWGGNFMKTKGEERNKAVNTIKEDPRFSKLMSNPELIKNLYTKGCKHPQVGVKITNEFFEALGCDFEETADKK